jgi:L-alanine-DL-glutamate epimerase-like enolase superfamily enzyme
MKQLLHDPVLRTEVRRWQLRQPFAISRHVFQDNLVLQVDIDCGGQVGRGECEPHEFDEAVTRAAARELQAQDHSTWAHLDPLRMSAMVPRCAWRNALDCALWDLRAKRLGRRVWEILGLDLDPGASFPIFQTLSLDTPERMSAAATASRAAPGLKIKLGGADGRDAERLEAIRGAAPGMPLCIDANEGWSPVELDRMLPLAARLDVAFIEQPVPRAVESALAGLPRLVPLCADESCLGLASLPALRGLYQMVNIKLDKTGGLTEALALVEEACRLGMQYMVGCNAGSSLAQAPAVLLAPGAMVVDLGVSSLAADHVPPLDDSDYRIRLPPRELWG